MSGFPNSGGVSSAAANTFTNSPQTINIPAAGKIGLIVKASAGQTADLQEWQDSTGTVVAYVSNTGAFVNAVAGNFTAMSISQNAGGRLLSFGPTGFICSTTGTFGPSAWLGVGTLEIYSTLASRAGLVVRGITSQTGDLQQWQNSAGAVLFAVGANGTIATGTTAGAPTIASAATIAPVTPIAFVSGVITINTITPPAPISTNGGQITLIPTGIFTTGVSGNIAIASTAVVSKALILTYDPITTKWYPSY